MAERNVLILSHDNLAAALLGLAADLAGGRPRFVAPGESYRDALLRHRPALVLVDCDDDACADSFLGPVLMTGARVAIFRSSRSRREIDDLVRRLGVHELRMPMDAGALATLLRETLD